MSEVVYGIMNNGVLNIFQQIFSFCLAAAPFTL